MLEHCCDAGEGVILKDRATPIDYSKNELLTQRKGFWLLDHEAGIGLDAKLVNVARSGAVNTYA